MIAPEGTRPLLASTFLGLVLVGGGLALGGWGWLLVALGAGAAGFALWSFRDPYRTPPPGADDLLLAPADGTVVEIAEEHEPLFLEGLSRRVSIFLSPLNVHVTRSPATATVEVARYVPGRARVAWHPDAPVTNSRTHVGLRHHSGVPVLLTQILGSASRRTAPASPVGSHLGAGDRLGVVPLGTRLDVAVPQRVILDVAVGQRTVAGETVIGRLPSSAGGDGLGRLAETPLLEVA